MDWGETLITWLGKSRSNVLSDVLARTTDLAKGLDPAIVTTTNPEDGFIQFDSAARKWKKYANPSWVDLVSYYDIELKAFTGDVTKPAGSSVLTIPANKISNAMLRDSGACSVIGRSANSSGDPADISAASDNTVLRRTGGTLNFGQITAEMVPAGSMTLDKIQDLSTNVVLGRDGASSGPPTELSCTAAGRAMLAAASASAQLALLIPAGTRMLFQQTSAPTGWVKETDATYNNSALRVVSGAVTTGGVDAFSTVFGAGKTTGSTVLTVAQMPPHQHNLLYTNANATGLPDSSSSFPRAAGGGTNWWHSGSNPTENAGSASVQATGGGQGHTHTLALNLKYVDLIIATKA